MAPEIEVSDRIIPLPGLPFFSRDKLLYKMEIEPNLAQVDFEVSLNSFHDEVLSKLEYLNTVEIELLRRFECNINLPDTHTELVFYLRNMIQLIEEAFKDVESYFQDLRMNYLYDYFRKVQVLMINGFNFLSQALLIQIDANEKEKECKVKTKEIDRIVVRHRAEPAKNLKEQAKEIEHYDFAINYYENEEAKIAEEMHRIQENIIMSKGLVDKLHPSKAVQELQEIKERAEITLENTEKIFEETYQLKYLEFKQYLSKLQRPEDITKDFCDNLKVTMFDKFESSMKKSVNLLYSLKKEDELSRLTETAVQTDEIEFPTVKLEKKMTATSRNGQKLQNLLLRERKLTEKLLAELQVAKKDIETLQVERHMLQTTEKEQHSKIRELSYNYDILSKIYDEKREEISILKKSVEEKDLVIEKLKMFEYMCRDIASADEAAQTEDLKEVTEVGVQANMQENEIIVILKKTNEKMGEKIRQKEIRIKEIEKKQITEKKEKLSRLRISQVMVPEIIASLPKGEEGRSSQSSDKSLFSNTLVRDDKQRTSLLINPPEKNTKEHTKMLIRPSIFALKRPSNSNKEMTSEKKIERPESSRKSSIMKWAEMAVQADLIVSELKPMVSKETQVDFIFQANGSQERRTEGVRREQKLKNRESKPHHYIYGEALSQRKEEKPSLKKILPSSREKERRWQKESSAESNFEDNSLTNRCEPFPDAEDHSGQREHQAGFFEYLNIETEECKLALQKRSALSKKFLCNIRKREKSIEPDEKNKTCIGEFYKSRKTDDNMETKHLICIDRIDLTKKQSRKYQKMSVNSKPSQKRIRPQQKQNSEKPLHGRGK